MVNCWMKRRAALRGIALGTALGSTALAQNTPGSQATEDEDCTPSRQPHECSDRCPSYDTCLVPEAEQLYYQVGEERFDCDGLDCAAASVTLGDYCCRRGAFAPDEDDGGGCTVAPGGPQHLAGALAAVAALVVFGVRRRRGAATGDEGAAR